MQAKAVSRFNMLSARKARLVADLVRGKGVDVMLVYETIRYGASRGICRGECSWILEDNMKMRRPIEKIGGRITQTYRVYELRV
mgnify:CR=1 FL=1